MFIKQNKKGLEQRNWFKCKNGHLLFNDSNYASFNCPECKCETSRNDFDLVLKEVLDHFDDGSLEQKLSNCKLQ